MTTKQNQISNNETNSVEDCIFCNIVQKQAPASIVYEDDFVMAFMDIKPLTEGHTLVIPKAHYEGIFDIPVELLGKVHQAAKIVAHAVTQAVTADGISIVQQNGKAANQVVFHLHVHVIPKFVGQNSKAMHELQIADYNQLNLTAAKIKQHI